MSEAQLTQALLLVVALSLGAVLAAAMLASRERRSPDGRGYAPGAAESPDLLGRLQEWGLVALVARVRDSRLIAGARAAALEQLMDLAGTGGWYVERDVHLDGRVVPFMLVNEGAFAVIPTVGWRSTEMPMFANMAAELRSLVEPADMPVAVIIYSPYTEEAAKRQTSEGDVWSIGGIHALRAWLDERPTTVSGSGRVDVYRDGANAAAPRAEVGAAAASAAQVPDIRTGGRLPGSDGHLRATHPPARRRRPL